MRFYKNIVISTGTIDYYVNRLYNNIVVSQWDEKVFRPADSVFKAIRKRALPADAATKGWPLLPG